MASSNESVLVTGGSGFIGTQCIIHGLTAGYRVKATVRSLNRKETVLQMLQVAGAPNPENVSFVEADLTKDDGWKEAVQDCTYVLHVASPFPAEAPKNENDLIIPARDGTLRVLRAARDAGVKRVVVTSSYAAIGHGHRNRDPTKPFTEQDWTDVDGPGVGAYEKSKTLAERAAWDFIEKEGGNLELSVVNPANVMGPVLGSDISTSIEVASRMLSGAVPGCPNIEFGIVDVRDVADLHLLAMAHPKAKGERFLCMAPPAMSIKDMALTLRERLGPKARKVPTRTIPDFVLRLLGLFDSGIALVVPFLSEPRPGSNEKAKTLLGWNPRSNADAVAATGESLIRLGIVKV
ncbi:NAD-dependent epimerase/dehydratase [Penicillium brasilianum]|uniref:NAD-dependent epimerase/dehydratase n=1 Tax=Penicillium brasilianum TaxID=104259 RepID=A0A1S9RMF9_PENBI|nr:NAD-dependent epimerase/dehydratase [Penicillium brasilianum]